MSEFGIQMLRAASEFTGSPFRNHYKPNECNYGRQTLPECMERGLDSSGFDCSGLVIRSLCTVLGVSIRTWPSHLRHSAQFRQIRSQLAAPGKVEEGDVIVYGLTDGHAHLGIATDPNNHLRAFHSNGLPRASRVEESIVIGPFSEIRVIGAATLQNIAAPRSESKLAA